MIRLVRVIVFDLPSIEVHRNGELKFASSDRELIAAELSRGFDVENPMHLIDAAMIYGEVVIHERGETH
jgi:hypothetical protein